MGWVIAFGVLGLATLLGGLIVSVRSRRSLVEERLGLAEEPRLDGQSDGDRRSPLGDVLNSALASRGLGANLATQLARADVKVTVGEFMAATIMFVVLGGALGFYAGKNVLFAIGGCLLGFYIPRIYLSVLRGRRLTAFNNQLSNTINLLVNGIKSGYSILQAMEAVSREMGAPIATEFGRVVQEQQLGLSMEQGLDNMLRRIPSEDLDMMITAINVQREVGGNLAEVLDSISYTIRERIRIKGEIRALTAQSRWSGYMISAVPVVLAVVVYLINPGFMSLLFTERCGWLMIGVAVVGIIAGYIVISKVVNIEV